MDNLIDVENNSPLSPYPDGLAEVAARAIRQVDRSGPPTLLKNC